MPTLISLSSAPGPSFKQVLEAHSFAEVSNAQHGFAVSHWMASARFEKMGDGCIGWRSPAKLLNYIPK
jgi:hypothetical protein